MIFGAELLLSGGGMLACSSTDSPGAVMIQKVIFNIRRLFGNKMGIVQLAERALLQSAG